MNQIISCTLNLHDCLGRPLRCRAEGFADTFGNKPAILIVTETADNTGPCPWDCAPHIAGYLCGLLGLDVSCCLYIEDRGFQVVARSFNVGPGAPLLAATWLTNRARIEHLVGRKVHSWRIPKPQENKT